MLKIGHRGWRGNYPENTLYGIEKLFEIGISCVEIDVVVNKDGELVISHEPWMNHKFCLDTQNQEIEEFYEKDFNIYEMRQSQINDFDCGSKQHPDFPFQENKKCSKPLLRELLEKFDWADKRIFLEIKCDSVWDGRFHPDLKDYASIIEKELKNFPYYKNIYLMSFDIRILNELQYNQPLWKYIFLSEENPKNSLRELNFTPEAVGLDYKIITQDTCEDLKQQGISTFAWTVNNWNDINNLLKMDIAGIISDFPNRL